MIGMQYKINLPNNYDINIKNTMLHYTYGKIMMV